MESIMARRPTLADVAKEAEVGVATVDRVINGRAFVRPETAERVYRAARAVGYHGAPLLGRRLEAATTQVRLGFLLQAPEQPFYQALEKALRAACTDSAAARVLPEISYLPSQRSTDIVAGLRALARKVQAIAMVATDHPSVTAAASELAAAGIPVFTLLSDAAPGARRAYLGLDNRKAGRTAAWLLSRCMARPAKVAIFVGSHRFHGHELREIGARSYFREAAPELEIIDTQISLETLALAHEALLDLLRHHGNLGGVYVAGGGTEGAIAALREESRPGALALVCNELNDVTRAGLADGFVSAVISTPLATLSREAVAQMLAALDPAAPPPPDQTILPFEIFVSENI
jgi:LacI family transcriptional regulator, galactose operon repressor